MKGEGGISRYQVPHPLPFLSRQLPEQGKNLPVRCFIDPVAEVNGQRRIAQGKDGIGMKAHWPMKVQRMHRKSNLPLADAAGVGIPFVSVGLLMKPQTEGNDYPF